MARFTEQFIQQVAQATNIVDLVGRYVALKPRGKEFVGLCPFHDDHHPSMTVTAAKQIFWCPVCQAGGGVIKFLELYEKISFPEAVRALAERAGIPLPVEGDWQPSGGPNKSDLLKVTAMAARFFHDQLFTPAGKDALDYALSRGLTAPSIERFNLGYSPNGWDGLIQAARRQRIGEDQLVAAGLAARRDGGVGCYDRFRNRLMFPIYDPDNKVIAFGGRALDPSERAKYLNSPESILFDKSNTMYALNWARPAIVSSGAAVVVEGYMDAIMPLQAGVPNVVASLGTALTDRHVRLLSRYAREAVLVFDSDAAGMSAAERALEIFLAQQLHVRVAAVPSGKDPCDYVLAEGAEAFSKVLAAAPDALQYVWDRRVESYRKAGGNLADRGKLVDDFLRLVASSQVYGSINEIRRGELAQHIGHILNISAADLQQQMKALARKVSPAAPAAAPSAAGGGGLALAERQILEVLLNRPDLFDSAGEKVGPADFQDVPLRTVARCLWRLAGEGLLTAEAVLAAEEMSASAALVAALLVEGQRRGNDEQTLTAAVGNIAYRRDRRELAELKSDPNDENLRKLEKNHRGPDMRKYPKIQ